MISLLAAFIFSNSMKSVSYDFPAGTETKFNVKVHFDGYVPLFGGKNGKVDVDMIVKVVGVESKKPELQSVDSEIIGLKGTAFGMILPVNKNNIGGFYPKAVASFEPTGVVKSNTAEHKEMPVKLPGLDSQRLPEISYVPLILNNAATANGDGYEFTRTFNGAVTKYKISPGKSDDEGRVVFQIEVNQESAGFEDAYGNPAEESAAKSKLKTLMTGKGSATFDLTKHMFDKVVVETVGDTDVTVIKTGKTSKRSLKTTLTILRDGVKIGQ